MFSDIALEYIAKCMVCISCVSVFARLFKQSLIPAYIFSGACIGPYGADLVDYSMVGIFAKIGIILVLFFAGLSTEFQRFLKSSASSFLVLFSQLFCSFLFYKLCCICMPGVFAGTGLSEMLLWIFVCTLSSTACAVRFSEIYHWHLNVNLISILIVQDIALSAMVMSMHTASCQLSHSLYPMICFDFLKSIFPLLLVYIATVIARNTKKLQIHDGEYIIIIALTWCALGAYIFNILGLSSEYGGFMSGLVMGIFCEKEKIQKYIDPIRKAFLIAFFVFVGVKANPVFIYANLSLVLLFSGLIFIFKLLANAASFYMFVGRYHALQSGMLLSVLSELSFTLLAAFENQASYNVQLIESVVIVSIVASAFFFGQLSRIYDRLVKV